MVDWVTKFGDAWECSQLTFSKVETECGGTDELQTTTVLVKPIRFALDLSLIIIKCIKLLTLFVYWNIVTNGMECSKKEAF